MSDLAHGSGLCSCLLFSLVRLFVGRGGHRVIVGTVGGEKKCLKIHASGSGSRLANPWGSSHWDVSLLRPIFIKLSKR